MQIAHYASLQWHNEQRFRGNGNDGPPRRESWMDDLDRKLIGLLRENARMPAATLAKSLKVARGTVQNRLAKLERDGIIAGYTIRLRPKIDEQGIVALMTIAVEGNRIEPVLRTLRGDPAIV